MRVRAMVTLALAYVAGFVDALCFRAFGYVYTSHMTGNTAALGVHLVARRWGDALTHAIPIAAFLLGGTAGALLDEVAAHRRFRAVVAPGLGLEAAILGAWLVVGNEILEAGAAPSWSTARSFVAVGLAAAAMGVQTVTFRRIDGMSVRTTFITGMLANLVEEAVDLAVARRTRRDRALFAGSRRPSPGRIAILGGIWIGFFLGVISGALGAARWPLLAIAVPIGLLVLLLLLDLRSPYGAPADSSARRRIQRWRSGE